jgi:hypothetical protein
LDEESLEDLDSDEDGRIDTLIITYEEVLTGTVNTGAFLLSSATGGLYLTGISSATGYILSGSIDENTLILSIVPSDFEKNILKVNATTASELRLKTSGNIGVTTIDGQPLTALLLIKSFNSYKNVTYQEVVVETSADVALV